MEILLAIFALVVIALGLYLLARRRRSILSADSDADAPYAGVPARLTPRPGGRSGTAALEEPDENDTI
ncbi:MAG TPA: hypothetical protein VFA71_07340 [Terriglobales bacterium]|nr:hypothetical protein [Terriglobales bacterium]